MSKTHAKETPARTEGEANHRHKNFFDTNPKRPTCPVKELCNIAILGTTDLLQNAMELN
jgi:hypothetical protein